MGDTYAFGGADDDTYSEFTVEGGDVVDGVESAEAVFTEEAVSAQRLVVSRMFRSFVKGHAHVAYVDASRKLTGEKLFSIPTLFDWVGAEPTAVLDALRAGRVRARVNAAMGVGKTVRLAPLIARTLGLRVLLVGLEANLLRQVEAYVSGIGLGQYGRRWPRKTTGEALFSMTYGDFNGYMVGGERSRLFSSFDVIIFDEAFVAEADVFVAKRNFAAYAHPGTSLLLCSATIRTDAGGSDGASAGLGAVRSTVETVTVEAAIMGRKLVTEYLADRTCVFVPMDSQLSLLREHYEHNGVDVDVLDSASTGSDVGRVCSWLSGDSSTPRVLLAHSSYGIGANFPVSFIVAWAQREVLEVRENRVVRRLEPMTEQMVTQMMSRSGRGMVKGSGGLIMVAERAKSTELYEDHRHLAFVKLCASGLVPLKNGAWDTSYSLFPGGLTPAAAANLLKVGLPPEVAARFFAADGCVASKYATAINLFAQPDHFLLPSAEREPCGFEAWPVQTCMFRDEDRGVPVEVVHNVPLEADGELQVVLHTIVAVAAGEFRMDRWRPAPQYIQDGYDSGDSAEKLTVVRLRRVREQVQERPQVEEAVASWSYQPSTAGGYPPDRRGGRFVDSGRFREALARIEQSLSGYEVPAQVCEAPVSPVDPEVVELEMPVTSAVESPGGSTVCLLDRVACGKLNRGQVLEPREFVGVLWSAKGVLGSFVASRMFDMLAGPWESVLRSLDTPDVVNHVVGNGEATVAYAMVDMLRGRFNNELLGVLRTSNLLRTRFRTLFRTAPSPESVMRKVVRGDFDNIAQTQGYFRRVRLIKRLIDAALLRAESASVYLPNHITNAQRMLYLGGGGSAVGTVGGGLHMPRRGAVSVALPSETVVDRLARRLNGVPVSPASRRSSMSGGRPRGW